MSMIVFRTECLVNYGDSENPWWGVENDGFYRILNVPDSLESTSIDALIEQTGVCNSDSFTEESLVESSIVSDEASYKSVGEKAQIRYYGRVLYPDVVFDYADLVNEMVGEVVYA